MAATDEWTTPQLRTAVSPGLKLNGRKLGLRWDASSVAGRLREDYPVNAYQLKIWGSTDGVTKNRLVELLAASPQEVNEQSPELAYYFYQGAFSGLTVPYPYAIVELNTDHTQDEKGNADLASNNLTAWLADAEPLSVAIPIQGCWKTLPGGKFPATEQVRDYARVIRSIDVTVYLEHSGELAYYEQSRNEMRHMATYPIVGDRQTAINIRRGGFPRFSLLVKNNAPVPSRCELVAIARDN